MNLKVIKNLIFALLIYSCSNLYNRPVYNYPNEEKIKSNLDSDVSLKRGFEDYLDNLQEADTFRVFFNPHNFEEKVIINDLDTLFFNNEKKISEREMILGKSWKKRDFNKKSEYIKLTYKKKDFKIILDKKYFMAEISPSNNTLSVDFITIPFFIYHE